MVDRTINIATLFQLYLGKFGANTSIFKVNFLLK